MLLIIALCFISLFLGLGATSVQADVFVSEARLATLKERVKQRIEPTFTAFQRLQREADSALNDQPHAPTEWHVPGFYKDPSGHNKAKGGLASDANDAYELALAYRMTGEGKYATVAIRLINAWPATVKIMSNKDDSMLSFSYHFPAMIFAAALLEKFPGWSNEEQQAFQDFVRRKALPMNSMSRENNWGNWGLVLVLASASYLHDQALFSAGVDRWKHFIESQIAPDGHLPLEVVRNNGTGDHGLWYSNFSLMPQTLAAEIARVNGTDLFEYRSPSGHSLKQVFQCLIPWVADPGTFPYYRLQSAQQPQFQIDYISYWEILNAHWPSPEATTLISARRPLSATHSAPALTFTHGNLLAD